MSQDPWNRPLPPDMILGGVRRFSPPLLDPTQSWVVSEATTLSSAPVIKSQSTTRPGVLTLHSGYSESSRETAFPGDAPQPPILDLMDWDWIRFHCQPLEDISVEVTHWVPDPRIICGRHSIHNNDSQSRQIALNLTCQVTKGKRGFHLSRENFQGKNILSGSSPDHNAVVFLTGSRTQSTCPSNQLITSLNLEPGGKSEIRWVLVWCGSGTDAHRLLEEVILLDWEGEIARRKITLSSQLLVKTGQADQDFSLAFSQRQARLIINQLMLQADRNPPSNLSLDPRQTWQLILALAPLESSSLEWLLKKTLREDREERPYFPLEAEILWRAQQAGISPEMLNDFLPIVTENLSSWFSRHNDRDGDGIPEEPGGDFFQLEPSPLDEGDSWMRAFRDHVYLETPGLAALLHNEITQLKKLHAIIPDTSLPPEFSDRIHALDKFLHDTWRDAEDRFRSRDYQSHFSEEGFLLPGKIQNGWNILQIKLPYPSRLSLQLPMASKNSLAEDLRITIQGTDWQGRYRIEELTSPDILWDERGGWCTTQAIFSRLDHCVVVGLERNQDIKVISPESDRWDISLTIPLWWEGLPAEIGQKLVSGFLDKPASFWSEYGFMSRPQLKNSPVQLPLNLLVSQGLIKAGHSGLAGEVFRCWLDTASINISRNGCLYAAWESKTGSGLGKANEVEGTLPIGLFLDLLGVRFLVCGDLILEERKPVLFPIQMIYRGAEITFEERETILRRSGSEKTSLPRGKKALIRF